MESTKLFVSVCVLFFLKFVHPQPSTFFREEKVLKFKIHILRHTHSNANNNNKMLTLCRVIAAHADTVAVKS